MKEYNVTVKIRNNYLLTAMRQKGCQTIADLHRLCGVGQGEIGTMLNLKSLPMNKKGKWRGPVMRVAKALGREPVELFPAEHLNVTLETNTAESEMSMEEITTMMIGGRPEHLLLPDESIEKDDVSKALMEALETLSPKEEEVLKMRFGLDGYEPHTLELVGNHYGVSKERIRQFEAKAMRKLRHPTRKRAIKEAGYEPTNGYEILNDRERSERWVAKMEEEELEETRLREEMEEEDRIWLEENQEGLARLKEEEEARVYKANAKAATDQIANLSEAEFKQWASHARMQGHLV